MSDIILNPYFWMLCGGPLVAFIVHTYELTQPTTKESADEKLRRLSK